MLWHSLLSVSMYCAALAHRPDASKKGSSNHQTDFALSRRVPPPFSSKQGKPRSAQHLGSFNIAEGFHSAHQNMEGSSLVQSPKPKEDVIITRSEIGHEHDQLNQDSTQACETRLEAVKQEKEKLTLELSRVESALRECQGSLPEQSAREKELDQKVDLLSKELDSEKNRTKAVILEIMKFEQEIGKILKAYFPQINDAIAEHKKREAYNILTKFINAFENTYDKGQHENWVSMNDARWLDDVDEAKGLPLRVSAEVEVTCRPSSSNQNGEGEKVTVKKDQEGMFKKLMKGGQDDTSKAEITYVMHHEENTKDDQKQCTVPSKDYGNFEVNCPRRGLKFLMRARDVAWAERTKISSASVPETALSDISDMVLYKICNISRWPEDEVTYCKSVEKEVCREDCWFDQTCQAIFVDEQKFSKEKFMEQAVKQLQEVIEMVDRHVDDFSQESAFLDFKGLKEAMNQCKTKLVKWPEPYEVPSPLTQGRPKTTDSMPTIAERGSEDVTTLESSAIEVQSAQEKAQQHHHIDEQLQKEEDDQTDLVLKFPDKKAAVNLEDLKEENSQEFAKMVSEGIAMEQQVRYATYVGPASVGDVNIQTQFTKRFQRREWPVACVEGISDEGVSVTETCNAGFNFLEEIRDLMDDRKALIATMKKFLDFEEWIDSVHDEHFPMIKKLVEDEKDAAVLQDVELAIATSKNDLGSVLDEFNKVSSIKQEKDNIYEKASCLGKANDACNDECELSTSDPPSCSNGWAKEEIEKLVNKSGEVVESVRSLQTHATEVSDKLAKAEDSAAKIREVTNFFPDFYFQVDDIAERMILTSEDFSEQLPKVKADHLVKQHRELCKKMESIKGSREEVVQKMNDHCKKLNVLNEDDRNKYCAESQICRIESDARSNATRPPSCSVSLDEFGYIFTHERFEDIKEDMKKRVDECQTSVTRLQQMMQKRSQTDILAKEAQELISSLSVGFFEWTTVKFKGQSLDLMLGKWDKDVAMIKDANLAGAEVEARNGIEAKDDIRRIVEKMKKETKDANDILATSSQVTDEKGSTQLLTRLFKLFGVTGGRMGALGIVTRHELLAIFQAQQVFIMVRSLRHMLVKLHQWRVDASSGPASNEQKNAQGPVLHIAEKLDKTYSPKVKKLTAEAKAMCEKVGEGLGSEVVVEVLNVVIGAKKDIEALKSECSKKPPVECGDFAEIPESVLKEIQGFENNLFQVMFRYLRLQAHELEPLLGKVLMLLNLDIADAEQTTAAVMKDMKGKIEAFKEHLSEMVTASEEGTKLERDAVSAVPELVLKLRAAIRNIGSYSEFEQLTHKVSGATLFPKKRQPWEAGPAELAKMIYTMLEAQIKKPLNSFLKAMGREIDAQEGGGVGT